MNWPPIESEFRVSFSVPGIAAPAGSKVSGVITRWDKTIGARVPVNGPSGYPRTFTRDSSGLKGTHWRSDVRSACADALPYDFTPMECPLAVEMVFVKVRPQGHYRTGRYSELLKDSAPRYPTTRPDSGKLGRSVLDALTGLLWKDDSLIVDERLSKEFGPSPECRITVWSLPTNVIPARIVQEGQESLAIAA